jgi:hypothetical protein
MRRGQLLGDSGIGTLKPRGFRFVVGRGCKVDQKRRKTMTYQITIYRDNGFSTRLRKCTRAEAIEWARSYQAALPNCKIVLKAHGEAQ